jgi:photosystem II stability/assembly factor-like uncharacterized protein
VTGPEDLLVATVGDGLWIGADGGAAWTRAPGVPPEAAVYSLAGAGDAVLAGGRGCVYRLAGRHWESLPLPDAALEVWTLAADPAAPSTVLAGCRPFALLRSDDGGKRWDRLPLALPPATPRPHTPRVTTILVAPGAIWCGAEVGGVFASEDDGESWTDASDGLSSLDVHALARGRTLVAATDHGLARHDGRWAPATLDAPWRYCRALVALPGAPEALLCGLGDGPPGRRGAVVRSADDGRSWRSTLFPGTAASTVWSLAVADDGGLVVAGAIGGELFVSDDEGHGWRRLPRVFADVRAVAVARRREET